MFILLMKFHNPVYLSNIPQHWSDHDIDMNLFSWQKPQAKQIMKRLLYTIFSNFLQLIFSIFVPGMKYDFWKFCSQTSKQTKIKCKHLQFKCQFQLNDAWKVIIDTEKSWVNSLFGRLINKDRKPFCFSFSIDILVFTYFFIPFSKMLFFSSNFLLSFTLPSLLKFTEYYFYLILLISFFILILLLFPIIVLWLPYHAYKTPLLIRTAWSTF